MSYHFLTPAFVKQLTAMQVTRDIDEIINHCTATREGVYVDVPMVRQWHLDRGWSDIGYHFLIGLNGEVWFGRDLNRTGAHVKGHNTGTIGISYVGGLDSAGRSKDTRTDAQKGALVELQTLLVNKIPSIKKISGHRDYAAKDCPCYDASEYEYLLDRKPPKPEIDNPKDDDDKPLSWLDETIAQLEQANLLQKKSRDLLTDAANLHWKVLQSLRAQRDGE